eukprot:gene3647-7274_t
MFNALVTGFATTSRIGILNTNVDMYSTSTESYQRDKLTLLSKPWGEIQYSTNDVHISRITTLEELKNGADLCIKVFFGESNNFLKKASLFRLSELHTNEMSTRFTMPSSAMYKAVDNDNLMVGFAEIFLWHKNDTKYINEFPTMSTESMSSPKYLYPKIANVAVSSKARRKGVGSRLLQSCYLKAQQWGYQEVYLLVDEDNTLAMDFYINAGFEVVGIDNKSWRYEWKGMFIKSVNKPQVLLRKALTMNVEPPLITSSRVTSWNEALLDFIWHDAEYKILDSESMSTL